MTLDANSASSDARAWSCAAKSRSHAYCQFSELCNISLIRSVVIGCSFIVLRDCHTQCEFGKLCHFSLLCSKLISSAVFFVCDDDAHGEHGDFSFVCAIVFCCVVFVLRRRREEREHSDFIELRDISFLCAVRFISAVFVFCDSNPHSQ